MEPLTKKEAKLAEQYFKFSQNIIRRIENKYPQYRDELNDLVGISVVIATKNYKKDLGITFKKYLYYALRSAIKDCLRKESKRGIKYYPKNKDLNFVADYDYLLYKESELKFIENKELVTMLLNTLSEENQFICKAYLMSNYTLRDISNNIGKCPSAIHTKLFKSLEQMKEKYKCLN